MKTTHQPNLFTDTEQAPYTAYVRLQGQRRWNASASGPDLWSTWAKVLRQTRPTSCDVTVLPRGETPR